MNSIEKRINLSLALTLSVVFAIFWWFAVMTIHHLTEAYILTRLEHDSQSILKHLILPESASEPSALQVEYDAINPIYALTDSGHYFVILHNGHTLSSRSLGAFELPLKDSSEPISDYETQGPANQIVLVRRLDTTLPNRPDEPITLYTAEDHSPIQRTLAVFDLLVGIFALVTLLLLFLSQRVLLRKGFKRLEPIQSALKDLEKGQATQLNPQDYPTEVTELILNLNRAILSASTQLQKSRQANANLAHSLKTPLNLLYQYLEDPALAELPALKTQLKQQVQKIHTRLENELQKARLANHALTMEPFRIQAHLSDLIQSLQQLYPQVRFHHNLQDNPISELNIEKEDGFELLGNLLDNAAKFSGGDVFLTLTPINAQHSEIRIEDNGHGVPGHQLDAIQARGYRLDETVAGHGLGLSIVKQITEAYRIRTEFQSSPLGGLRVTLTL